MLSQNERNAIDAYLSRRGINFAAMLRAEQAGYNLDVLRFEIIFKLSENSQKYLMGLPLLSKKNADKGGSHWMQ